MDTREIDLRCRKFLTAATAGMGGVGRVFKNVPAPRNLEVPRYECASDTLVLLGKDSKTA